MIQLKLEANSKYYYYDPLEKLIIPNGYQLNENLQHQENQVSLRIAYDSELHKILVENQNIPAKLVDGDKILFTGTIDSGISWTDNGNPEPLDCFNITIFDNSGKLQATTESEFAMINKSLTEIIVAICDNCGIVCSRTTFPVDDPIVPVFILPEGKEFYQPLSDLLFEYGYAFGFDNNGYFGLINLTQPQSATFHDDLYTCVKFSRTKKKYTGLSVTYGQLVQKNNEQIFFEGGDLDAENKILPIVIQPGAYYPWESDPIIEADEGQVFQQFAAGFAEEKTLYNGEKKYQRNNNSKLIYTTNHELVQDFSDNLTVDRKEFSFTQASIRFHNRSTTDATLKQLAIRATAYYRQEQQIILGSGKKFEYQTNYLYDKAKTDAFVEILKKYFLGGNFKITFKTDAEFTPGTKTKLNTGLSGITADVLILSCEKDFDNENYTINAITIQDISLDEKKYQTQKSMTADQLIQRTEYTTTAIKTIQEEYYLSTSRTELIGGKWQTIPPTPSTNTYIWTRTQFIYNDGTEVTTDPISVSGENGDNIDSVDVEYAQNQSRTTAPTIDWQTTAPTAKDGYYTWSRTKIKLKNKDATYTDAVCITGDKGNTGEQGVKGDTGEQGVRGSLEFSGTEINSISDITEATYTITTASTGITSATMPILVGDTYINVTTQDVWICSTVGTPTTAKWKYQGRRCSDKDDSNRFRMFTPATDNGTMQSSLTKSVVKGENPFGKIDDLLKITNTNGTENSKYTPYNRRTKIDPKKTYRYVTYIKQEDANYTDYIGIATWESENSFCLSLSGSPINSAYFTSANNFGTLGKWYMIVGYIVANGTTTAPTDSGVYDMVTKQKVRDVTNYQWKSNVAYCTNSGCLIRYATSASAKTGTAFLYDIRLDEVNGTEPTLNELLNLDTTTKSKGAWASSTVYNTGDIVYLNGNSYICTANHTSGTSFSTTNWNLIASKGADGKNAITMTSATTPAGEYNGQIGIWRGQVYQWNGTSWVLTSGLLPTDPVLHYSFDELPDIPDGGTVIYAKNKDWVTTDSFLGTATTSVENGCLVLDGKGVDSYVFRGFATHSGCCLKIKMSYDTSGVVQVYENVTADSVLTTLKFAANEEKTVILKLSNNNRIVGLAGFKGKITIKEFYIGDAEYKIPIIDNSGNDNNATATRGIVTHGINNNGLFLNNQVSGSSFKIPNNFTVSLWCKAENNTNGLVQNIIYTNIPAFILRNGASWGNYLMYHVYTQKEDGSYDETGRPFIPNGGLLPANVWVNLVITKKDNIIKCYYNGELKKIDTRETGVLADHSSLFIGKETNTRGQTIDDLQIFNRALSDQEVLGLYLARGNTPKQYTFADYQLDNSSGKYYGYEKPAVPFKNDTYLDTTTGYLYEYDGVKWVAITDVADPRYNQAINDMIAFATENPNLPFITARNAWIERLAVDGLLANKIATQELKIRDGGIIHSDNYDGVITDGSIESYGTQGWAIDYSGKSDFTNVHISGDSEFEGLLKQGTNFYVATSIKISRKTDGEYDIQCSNPEYNGKVFARLDGEMFVIILSGVKKPGQPHVWCNYASDKISTAPELNASTDLTEDFAMFGTNPKYQLLCRMSPVYGQILPTGVIRDYVMLFFTDMNNDKFISVQYADLTIYYA